MVNSKRVFFIDTLRFNLLMRLLVEHTAGCLTTCTELKLALQNLAPVDRSQRAHLHRHVQGSF